MSTSSNLAGWSSQQKNGMASPACNAECVITDKQGNAQPFNLRCGKKTITLSISIAWIPVAALKSALYLLQNRGSRNVVERVSGLGAEGESHRKVRRCLFRCL